MAGNYVLVEGLYRWFRAILSYLQKSKKKVCCFPLMFRIQYSLKMCCNPTLCFNFQVIQFQFCGNSMVSEPLPNFKTQISRKDESGSYDNIALNQRYQKKQETLGAIFSCFVLFTCRVLGYIRDSSLDEYARPLSLQPTLSSCVLSNMAC